MQSLAKTKEIEAKKKKLSRLVYWSLISIIILYTLFGTKYNVITIYKQHRRHKSLKEDLYTITQNNSELRSNIDRLKNDPDAIEKIARERYKMKAKGEKIIRFKQEDSLR